MSFNVVSSNSFQGMKTRYVGPSGNRSIEFYLEPNTSIITLPGSLLYMRGNVQKGEVKVNSSSFTRLFTGETFTLVSYKGLDIHTNQRESNTTSNRIKGSSKGGYITLGLPIPGDIVCIEVKQGSKLKFMKNSFLACTPNLNITGRFEMKQFIPVGTDFEPFLGHVHHKENSNQTGYVWLSTYGVFEKIDLVRGDEIIIDNGMFLACDESYPYKVSRLGQSMFGGIISGEGWGVQFSCNTDKMTIYTQTKSIQEFANIIRFIEPNGNGNSTLSTIVDIVSGGEKKKKSTPRKKKTIKMKS